MQEYIDLILKMLVEYGPKLLGAIVVLIIGLWIIKMINKSIRKVMLKSKMDDSLVPFLSGIIDGLMKALLIISVMSMVGIAMTSFVAILGAAGLAVGMALSGTLQNFAGGVMILIFKPYKAGDFIEAQGYTGTVKEIQIFNTIMVTVDNRKIIIPNGGLSGSSMINYSAMETRRVDLTFGVSYSDDIEKSRQVILDEINKLPYILNEPAPFVRVSALADSSVNFATRVWVNAADYWTCYHDLLENVKKAMDANGISIPFPQTDVHVYNMK
ncbi:MAG: mechanosensitive ion channel [Bacteroidales bacterium]|nr:mechanosensitive ion channel [Bacteroidales bacterium]